MKQAKAVPKTKVKREKSTTTVGHYVRNADLLPAVIEAKTEGKITDKLIRMIQLIAERYSRKSWFIGYSFREDMVSSAVENLCKNALKFNHEKYANPFAFYTTAIHNSFLQFMADEKKHRNIRDKLLMDAGSNPSFNFMEAEKDETHFEVKESDEHHVVENEPVEDTEPLSKYDQPAVDADAAPAPVREVRVRHEARQPGAVARLSAGDFILDPVTNTYIRKPEPVAEPEPVKVKKPRAAKVVVEAVVEAPVKKTTKRAAAKVEAAPAKTKKAAKASEDVAVKVKKTAVKKAK